MIYLYINPTQWRPEFSFSGVSRTGSEEQLTGTVKGLTASDIEERMANAFDTLKIGFYFRPRISSDLYGSRRLMTSSQFQNLPGEVELDFLPDTLPIRPVLIDGEISHFRTYWQRDEDQVKTDIINEFGKTNGWGEVVRVPYVDILTPEATEKVAREISEGTYIPTYIG